MARRVGQPGWRSRRQVSRSQRFCGGSTFASAIPGVANPDRWSLLGSDRYWPRLGKVKAARHGLLAMTFNWLSAKRVGSERPVVVRQGAGFGGQRPFGVDDTFGIPGLGLS